MNLHDKIDKIKPYFVQINIAEQIMYVLVKFPEKWNIDKELENKFGVKIAQKRSEDAENKEYYIYATYEVGLEPVFNVIDFIIKFNLETEEKIKLLLLKIDELKKIFNDEDIDVLKTIEFKYKKKKNKITKNSNTIADESVETAMNEQNNENISEVNNI